MRFELSHAVNPPCVFLVDWSQLRGRLDAEYNRALLATQIRSTHPTYKVRELVKSRTGGTPSKLNQSYWQGTIPWASPKDFAGFHLVDTEDHISPAAVSRSATAVVPAGSLLVVFRSGVLQHSLPVAVTTRSTAINQDVKALIPSSAVSAEYLGAYFIIFGKRLLPLITKSGATVQSINTAQFDELGIPIPDARIQRQVVNQLVAAFEREAASEATALKLIASIDDVVLDEIGIPKNIEMPDTLDDRVFKLCFGSFTGRRWDPNYAWQMRRFLSKLESCAYPIRKLRDFIATVQYGISERATSEEVGIPMLRMLNLQDGQWCLDDMKHIALTDKEKKAFLLKKGDILFNRTNSKELIGKCIVFNFDEEYVFASYLVRVSLKTDAELLPDFVVAYMASSLGRIQIDAVSRQIAGMTNINAEEIRELMIPALGVKNQERVCEKVASIREQARVLRQKAREDLEKAKRRIEGLILGEAIP